MPQYVGFLREGPWFNVNHHAPGIQVLMCVYVCVCVCGGGAYLWPMLCDDLVMSRSKTVQQLDTCHLVLHPAYPCFNHPPAPPKSQVPAYSSSFG